jgi:hypothetical protein
MIYQMANGDPIKMRIIESEYDIIDYYGWNLQRQYSNYLESLAYDAIE